ncbi:hypothetical protein [Streptomyces sp. NPDC048332]|uniref:hypothetical protein n=1 Tax=unclassified Streptomyces TaxID=2593676 RepID=UPI00341B0F3E
MFRLIDGPARSPAPAFVACLLIAVNLDLIPVAGLARRAGLALTATFALTTGLAPLVRTSTGSPRASASAS